MILDLRVFDEYPAETSIYADPGELARLDDLVVKVRAAHVDLDIQKAADEYYCQGRVEAQVVVECARCLGEFDSKLAGEVDFVVYSREEATRHRDVDEEDYVCFEGNDLRVDIVVPVRQALVLSIPMKPLCSEDCRGLCPTCGANLNERTCDCKIETLDPRWDGLRKLFPDRQS
ncbi:MAG: DUF177 domain-containing protein [Candidatus Zixiibacteriota bacterium]